MRRFVVALAVLTAIVGTARAAAPAGPSIVGGSEQQRTLLARLAAGMQTDAVREIDIDTLGPSEWQPHSAGAVKIVFTDVPSARRSIHSWWEDAVVAGAFRDESEIQKLPNVVVYEDDAGGARIWPRWISPPPVATDERTQAEESQIRDAAAGRQATVRELLIRRPDGLAPEIVIAVRNPAAFLLRKLRGFLRDLTFFGPIDSPRLEGIYVRVVNRQGRFAWEGASATRVSSWAARTRPDLAGCFSLTVTGPMGQRPKPCPAR
jgi:hypothetical protein